ncbi:MAG: DUF4956 domain-containing protein [Oscillospiraceae bacterium]|nr:DUF4956 domain-containing protein [Oscillospiraceae bacterium]
MSAKDIIKKSVLESDMFNQAITLSTVITIVLDLSIALLMGLLIYAVYKKFFQGVIFSKSYATTLVGMTVLTCMVTLAISTNIVISLGMVGALSIVRYRTAIKEPLDLLYMFWAITTGITVGASMYILAAAGAVIVIVLVAVMGRKNVTQKTYIMVAHFTGDETADDIMRLLARRKFNVKFKTLRGEDAELTVEVVCDKKNMTFVERIRNLPKVQDVTLIQYNGEYHG